MSDPRLNPKTEIGLSYLGIRELRRLASYKVGGFMRMRKDELVRNLAITTLPKAS